MKLSFQSDGCGDGAHTGSLAYTKEDGLTTKVPAKVSKAYADQVRSKATAIESPSDSPSESP